MARPRKSEDQPAADLSALAAPGAFPVALVALSDLYIHTLNARSEPPASDIAALADSIADLGLLQNLAGYQEQGEVTIGIVAGGRRLRALVLLAGRDGRDLSETRVPVRITYDEETARLWASAENAAREALHPADEVRAYGRMAAAGADPDRIAKAFAVTARHVRQRLRLAQLPGPALDALRAGEITLDQAAALTSARDDAAAIEELGKVAGRRHDYSAGPDAIRNRLAQASVSAADRRVKYIGLDAYRDAGGRVQEDIFTDAVRLPDADLVAELFERKLREAAAAEQAEVGWKWVDIVLDSYASYDASRGMKMIHRRPVDLPEADADELDDLLRLGEQDELDDDQLARLDELEARSAGDYAGDDIATSGLWLYVDRDGDLCTYGPYRRPEDDPARAAADEVAATVTVAKPESAALSLGLADDIRRIRLAALQLATLADPAVILDLLCWQVSGCLPGYHRVLDLSLTRHPIDPEIPDGLILPERLVGRDHVPHAEQTAATVEAFTEFRNLGSAEKLAHLDRAVARAITGGGGYLPALADIVRPDPRAIWTPTATGFFSRLPVARLDRIWCDLVPDTLQPDHAAFRALKKGEKAQALHRLFNDADFREAIGTSRETNEDIDCWLPDEMQWPALEGPATQEAAE